jgi:hypothetical protein
MREELFGDEGAPADSVPAREPETRENHRAAS